MESEKKNADGYVSNGTLFIRATNMQDFKDLIQRAEKQSRELKGTLEELYSFEFKLELKAQ